MARISTPGQPGHQAGQSISGGTLAVEFSVREWMIIIGVLLIVAVLLDGYRRVRSERRNRIRVTLTKQALHRAHVAAQVEEAPPSNEPNPELPNGGARVIPKTSRQDLQLDQSVPVLMESVHLAPAIETGPEPEPEPELQPIAAAEPKAGEDETDDPVAAASVAAPPSATERMEPHFGELFADTPLEDPVEVEPAPELTWSEPVTEVVPDERAATQTDELKASTYTAVQPRSLKSDSVSDSRPNSAAQEVLIVNVLSKDKAGFKGQDVLQILLACDLRFGNMNIFHRYEKANGKGPVQFSVANLVEPGTFDLDRIESFSTPGLCFFLTLPGPEKSVNAFNYMVETAQVLVKNLHGELRDEAHSVMTQQTIEHCRQRIRDFERKQLTLHL